MSEADEPDGRRRMVTSEGGEKTSRSQAQPTSWQQIRTAFFLLLLLTFVTGALFPLTLAALGCSLFTYQASGSLIVRDERIVGSDLIGQEFSGPSYFHARPSAAGRGYDAASSGGTNLGPTNPRLRYGAMDDPATPDDESFVGVRDLAAEYRTRNGLPPGTDVPVDAITRSGSGLDPDISPDNAELQVPRVARVRHLSAEQVRQLVIAHTHGRQLGVFGTPRVAVLPLNVDLDRVAPLTSKPDPTAN